MSALRPRIILYEPFGIDLLAKLGVIYLSTYRIVHGSKREWTGTSSRKRKKTLTSNLLRNFYLEDNLKVVFFLKLWEDICQKVPYCI